MERDRSREELFVKAANAGMPGPTSYLDILDEPPRSDLLDDLVVSDEKFADLIQGARQKIEQSFGPPATQATTELDPSERH